MGAMTNGLGVLGGLKIAQARKLEQQKLAQSGQQIQNEKDYQDKMVQDAKDRLAELTQQHKAENAHALMVSQAAVAFQKVQQAAEQQRMVEQSNATGIPIPGAAVNTPLASRNLPGMVGVTQPAQPGTQTLPGAGADGGDLTLPFDPQAYLEHQKLRDEALKGPESAEARSRREELAAQLSGQFQNSIGLAKFQNELPPSATTQATLASEEKRAKDQRDAQRYDANLEASTRIRTAQISQGLEGGSQVDSAAEPIVQQLQNNQLSQEDLNELKNVPKVVKNTATANFIQAGGVIPTRAELGAVAKYAPVVSLLGKMGDYNKLINDNPTLSNVFGTDAWKQKKQLESDIDLMVPNLARTLGAESGRLSTMQITKADGSANPSSNWLTANSATNQKKVDDLHQFADDQIGAALSRLPPGQAASIKAKTGLTKIPYGAPQQPQPQPGVQLPGQPGGPPQPQHLYFDANGKLVNQ